MAIMSVTGHFIAIENRGGDIETKVHQTREAAEHSLLQSFSWRLAVLDQKLSALADLFDVYERGDFGDGNMHRGFMQRLLRECSSIALRLHSDDPAWSLLGNVTAEDATVITTDDGTEIKTDSDAEEWMRLKWIRLHHEGMRLKEQEKQAAKDAADAADPEKQRRLTRASRDVLRAAISIAPPAVVAAEMKRAAKRTRRVGANKTSKSSRRKAA